MEDNKKPNHVCMNRFCHKGADGGPAHYYACDDCSRKRGVPYAWKNYCCSIECFQEFIKDLEDQNRNVDFAHMIAKANKQAIEEFNAEAERAPKASEKKAEPEQKVAPAPVKEPEKPAVTGPKILGHIDLGKKN